MMKKLLGIFAALLFSQPLLAAQVAGVNFLDIADTLDSTTGGGTYQSNWTTGQTAPESAVDNNGATWVLNTTEGATLNMSFSGASSSPFNVSDVDLTILLVGDGGHAGSISLFGGSQSSPAPMSFSLAPGVGYTGFNSLTDPGGNETTYAIYAITLHLADAFAGTFSGVSLEIGGNTAGSSAVPSMIGTVAPVPVPAAVWLFGSGLLGLAGIARKRA